MDRTRSTRDCDAAAAAPKEPLPVSGHSPHPFGARGADAAHLDALPKRRPARKSVQIRCLWPKIRAALAAGHSIRDVRGELSLDGLEISYSKLRTYIARLRKTDPQILAPNGIPDRGATPPNAPPAEIPSGAEAAIRVPSTAKPPDYDPLANLRERLTRRPGFHYDDRPPDEKKLI